MKEKLKKNKVLLVLLSILAICFVLILVALFKYFYTGNNSNKYGDRLEGVETAELHSTIQKEIEDLYSDSEVDSVKVKTSGKIVYLTINLKEVKKKADAKNLALKALAKFTEEEQNFYDIQFIITCESESSEDKLYPAMGYKNSSSSVVVWTKG